jgi:hypothetical protein
VVLVFDCWVTRIWIQLLLHCEEGVWDRLSVHIWCVLREIVYQNKAESVDYWIHSTGTQAGMPGWIWLGVYIDDLYHCLTR